jgi:hypothetical protein
MFPGRSWKADIHFFQKVCDELLQHLDLPLQTSVALRAFFERDPRI